MKKGNTSISKVPRWHKELVMEGLNRISEGTADLIEWEVVKKQFFEHNGVPIILGDSSVDISEMNDLISENKMDARKLRKEAWQRNK